MNSHFPNVRRPLRLALTLCCVILYGCAAQVHHRKGLDALDKEDYREAVKELQAAAKLAPDDVAYRKDWLQGREKATGKLLALASAASSAGDQPAAEKLYREVLAYEPGNARALEGVENAMRAARSNEELAKARDAIKRGDLGEAGQWLTRAQQRSPELPEALALKRQIETLQSREMIVVPSMSALYKKPINLEFRDSNLKMVFDALSRTTGINFIFDRDVKGEQRTTVFLKQTTLEDAIDVILATNQLDKKILNASSVLIYPNTPAKAKEYQDLVVKAFYMANVEAKQAASLLKTVLKVKDVFVDDRYNMLVLRETPETIVLAEKLIALHDLEEPEVMLEVEVLEVNRNRLLNLGIQYSDQFTISPLSTTTQSGGGTGTSSTSTLKLSDFLNLNQSTLSITAPSATINLQKIDGDGTLLANPRLRVRDREKAKILIGDKVPVVTTTTTPNGFLSENIQYLDVGLKLEVEPEIHLHDEIGLKMVLEVSSLVSTVKTTTGSQAYQIGTRNFSSSLRLRDGETQVLAGLISDADRSSANRVPLLGELPLLGRLFSSQKDDHQKTEIVMSITPHLVRNMRRKDPSTEAFWSGTEANLRTRALRLNNFDVPPTATPAPSNLPAAAGAAAAVPVTNTSGVQLQWKGKEQAKVGENYTLELRIDSAHALRAAPLQLAYNPQLFDVVSVTEGDFFNKDGKGSFNHVIDKDSGRVSVGTSGGESGAKGEARILTLVLRPLRPSEDAQVAVIGLTPIGARQAVGQVPLPIVHKLVTVP